MKFRIKKQVFNAINTIHTPQYKRWYSLLWRNVPIERGVYEFYSYPSTKTWAEQHLYMFMCSRFKHKKAIGLRLLHETKKFDFYTMDVLNKKH